MLARKRRKKTEFDAVGFGFPMLLLVFLLVYALGVVLIDLEPSKSVKEEYYTVDVKVVGAYQNRPILMPLNASIRQALYNQEYEIVVLYNGSNYSFYGKDVYDKYKDEKQAEAILKVTTYVEGYSEHRIVNLKQVKVIRNN